MNRKSVWALIAAIAGLMTIGGLAGYRLGQRTSNRPPMEIPSAQTLPSQTGQRIVYWYDPMKPDQHFDKPGKSPFMDMDLVPMVVTEDPKEIDKGVRIDPRLLQNTGVRLALVERGPLDLTVEAEGTLTFDERQVTIIQARSAGLVERVYALAPNDVIDAGAPLADLRIPEWYGAQMEFIALRKANEPDLAAAARNRLKQLGMTEEQVTHLDHSDAPQAVVTVTAPQGGVLSELGVRAGMTVTPGQTLARINGLGTIWMDTEIPEALGQGIAVGQLVSATFTGLPGQTFTGRIITVLPVLNVDTRTLRLRIEWTNPGRLLRPGMYAKVRIERHTQSHVLMVPAEAVIVTGERYVVITMGQEGHFLPVEVVPGREGKGKTEILSGLQEGQKIVTSGQFLIDSEASLKGVLTRMEKTGAPQ